MTNQEATLKAEAKDMDASNYSEARAAYYQADAALATLQEALAQEGPASPALYKIAKGLKKVIADFDEVTDGLGNTF